MEFSFDVNELFPQHITRTVAGRLRRDTGSKKNVFESQFATVVDAMGEASAKAQDLRTPITTFQKLQSSKQALYTMKESSGKGAVVGIIKVGRKRLFLNDLSGQCREVEPVCVLDFYVHESRQRCGYGRQLFEAMLETEGVKAFEVAIDRPSPKFINFLRKHYNLESYLPQANNYVVFNEFFNTCIDVGPSKKSLQDGDCSFASPFPSSQRELSDHSRIPYNHLHPAILQQQQSSNAVKRFSKRLSIDAEQKIFSFSSHGNSNSRTTEVASYNTTGKDVSSNATIRPVRHGSHSDSEFSWSPAGAPVTKSSASSTTTPAARPGADQQQEYDIITGRPFQKQSQLSRHFKWSDRDTSKGVAPAAATTHAPYLNMRRMQKPARLPPSSSFAVSATAPSAAGFYSTVAPTTAGATEGLQSASLGYSRHSGARGEGHNTGSVALKGHGNMLGVHGTSITHGPSTNSFNTRRKLTFKDKQHSHVA